MKRAGYAAILAAGLLLGSSDFAVSQQNGTGAGTGTTGAGTGTTGAGTGTTGAGSTGTGGTSGTGTTGTGTSGTGTGSTGTSGKQPNRWEKAQASWRQIP